MIPLSKTMAYVNYGWFTRKILPTKEASLLENVLVSSDEAKVLTPKEMQDKAIRDYYPIFRHKGCTYWFNTDTNLWYFSDKKTPTPCECGNWDKVVERLRFNGASDRLMVDLNYG